MRHKKVVLVTGSSRGIGAATIKKFASNGYNVVINYISNEEKAFELKKYVEDKYKIKALVIKCDISNESEVVSMIEEIIQIFGHIDVLVNNAGIAMDNGILNKTKEEFIRVLEVNLIGTFMVSREVLIKGNVKAIINVSSTDSIDTYNELCIDYCTSKAGINILTKIFSDKFQNVKICAVSPNWVNTESVMEMFPQYLKDEMNRIGQKRLLTVEEVSKRIYEIVDNRDIKTGDIIRIDCEDEQNV